MVKLRYVQKSGDNDYGTCLWADFLFDLDEYQLNINSDCGSYAYGWPVTPAEPFLKLMARINTGYLLNKIARQDQVDMNATSAALKDLVNQAREEDCIRLGSAARLLDVWDDIEMELYAPDILVDELLRCSDRQGVVCFDYEEISDWTTRQTQRRSGRFSRGIYSRRSRSCWR